jgi:hypothetical protein
VNRRFEIAGDRLPDPTISDGLSHSIGVKGRPLAAARARPGATSALGWSTSGSGYGLHFVRRRTRRSKPNRIQALGPPRRAADPRRRSRRVPVLPPEAIGPAVPALPPRAAATQVEGRPRTSLGRRSAAKNRRPCLGSGDASEPMGADGT